MSGLEADALVLLTNVDGLLRADARRQHRPSRRRLEVISLVEEITPELKALAAGPSASGRGGMRTKLEAADIAMNCGGTAVIANGNVADALDRIFAGDNLARRFCQRSACAESGAGSPMRRTCEAA